MLTRQEPSKSDSRSQHSPLEAQAPLGDSELLARIEAQIKDEVDAQATGSEHHRWYTKLHITT